MNKIKFSAVNILAATFILIFLAFSFFSILFFYWGDVSSIVSSLTIVGSFFGGISTLIAAYIAFLLYAEWRTETDYNHQLQLFSKLIDVTFNLLEEIKNLRCQKEILELLVRTYMVKNNNNISEVDKITQINEEISSRNIIDLAKTYHLTHEITKLVKNIDLFDKKAETLTLSSAFIKLRNNVETFQLIYSQLTSNIYEYNGNKNDLEWIQKAFYCNNLFYAMRDIFNIEGIVDIENILSNELDDSFDAFIESIFDLKQLINN